MIRFILWLVTFELCCMSNGHSTFLSKPFWWSIAGMVVCSVRLGAIVAFPTPYTPTKDQSPAPCGTGGGE